MKNLNYLTTQFKNNNKVKLNHSYLVEQFRDYNKIYKSIIKVVKKGDYTLGSEVSIFEKNIAKRMDAKFCISVANGTDALFLSLKVLNIGIGDEVITTPYSFIATSAAIVNAGAKPVFVDIKNDYNINEDQIVSAITKKTKAILPVHWAGRSCELNKIYSIAKKYKLKIIQDSSHAIDSRYYKKSIVKFGDLCTFSMHPLKNLNVWGDGGFILTDNTSLAKKLFLLRNHGLKDRNNCEFFSFNSRLDSIQASIANYKLRNKLDNITRTRIENAKLLDKNLRNNKNIILIKRKPYLKEVYHLYHVNVKKNRDQLVRYLISKGIDAKIHYPKPIHLQKAAKFLRYKKGDFPNAEALARTTISLPVHEFISEKNIKFMCNMIDKFYQ